MNSPNHSLSRWFRGNDPASSASPAEKAKGPRISRRSIGFGEFMRALQSDLKAAGEKKLAVLDLGSTSPANISLFTEMGLRVSTEDVLRACKDPDYFVRQEDGSEQFDANKFLAENLAYPEAQFDAVLSWDIADYVPEQLVKPLVERIFALLKPHGTLLAFFHDKDLGGSPFYRYHIVQPDTLEMEAKPSLKLQRIFNNRHIEQLFANFASRKFFLGRDNLREVIIVR
ncbi:MAG: SAM-dependent methyltransferase [Actinomycetota bacterium]